jgi:hypothetical protein
MLAWSEAIRTVSPRRTSERGEVVGCRNAGLYGRPARERVDVAPDEL